MDPIDSLSQLGEIEHVLRAQRGINEAVVLLHTDLGEPCLVAFVSPASVLGVGSDGSHSAIPFDRVSSLRGVRDTLPGYMVPSLVVGIEAWPRTSSEKIDRLRLPKPIRQAGAHSGRDPNVRMSAHAPVAAAERHDVLTAVSEHLITTLHLEQGEHLDLDAPLMEIGVSSLQAVRHEALTIMRSKRTVVGFWTYPLKYCVVFTLYSPLPFVCPPALATGHTDEDAL